jgi:hypothetical protein
MRVNIREDVQISSRRYGRDALPDRVPTMGVDLTLYVDAHGRPPDAIFAG